MSIHLGFFILLVAWYLYSVNQSMQRNKVTFAQALKFHFLLLWPAWYGKIKKYNKIYNDPDIHKVAKAQGYNEIRQLYLRSWAVYTGSLLWGSLLVYTNLRETFGWSIVREADFVFNELWWLPLLTIWIVGTSKSNAWVNTHLIKAPSRLILEWGELYRRGQLQNPLHIKLVEKYWYIFLISKAFAALGGKEYGFQAVPNPDGSLNLEASRLPRLTLYKDNRLEIDTQNFLLPYEVFTKTLLKKLESFTGLRTISFSKSGRNAMINWQVTHKPLPDKMVEFKEAPKPQDSMTQYIGYIGISDDKTNPANWVPVRWKVAKHLVLVGNTGMGKSVIMRTIMAGSQPETIILAGDLGDADAVSFVRLKYDPYQLEALDKERKEKQWTPEVYSYKKQQLDPLPTVIISRNKNEYFKMCQWLTRQFLDRTVLCGEYHSCEDVFEIYEKTGFKVPRIMLFLDEAASAFINASENDAQATYIKKTIFDMLVKGRKMDIVVVPATQYASMEALGKARAQMHAITVYTKGSNTKLVYGEEIEIPAPGLDGEFIGTFVMETPDGGYVTAKSLFISQEDTAKIIFNRANPPQDKLTESMKYTLQLWMEGMEAVETVDEFVHSNKKVKINYTDHAELINA